MTKDEYEKLSPFERALIEELRKLRAELTEGIRRLVE